MVTYGDYFSRKTLLTCGVSPDSVMIDNVESYNGERRKDNILTDMSRVFNKLIGGIKDKSASEKENFLKLDVKNKIIIAFYDSGILTESEKEFFKGKNFDKVDEREKIEVKEAGFLDGSQKSEMVRQKTINNPLKDVRK